MALYKHQKEYAMRRIDEIVVARSQAIRPQFTSNRGATADQKCEAIRNGTAPLRQYLHRGLATTLENAFDFTGLQINTFDNTGFMAATAKIRQQGDRLKDRIVLAELGGEEVQQLLEAFADIPRETGGGPF